MSSVKPGQILFYAGERLRCPGQAAWGIGQVLEDTAETNVNVFFEQFGRKVIDVERVAISRVDTGRQAHPILDLLLEDLNWKKAHHSIYVVLLEKAVLNHQKFREANRQYQPGKACVYVGMTGLDPARRFENHKKGYKSNYYVQRYGIRLLDRIVESFNPMPYRLAQAMEEETAKRLRELGHAVWQH